MPADELWEADEMQRKGETLEGTLCPSCDTLIFKATRPEFRQKKSALPLRLDLHPTHAAFLSAALTCPLCRFAIRLARESHGGSNDIGEFEVSETELGSLKVEMWSMSDGLYKIKWLGEIPPGSLKASTLLEAYLTESECKSCPDARPVSF
jgi:hypothetical protein